MAVQALPASSSPALSNTALLDYLELDSRPAFAVDINIRTRRYNALLPLAYYNPALRAADGLLLERVTGQQSVSSTRHQAFVDWICGVAVTSDPSRRGFAYVFEGYLWTTVTIGQYTTVSGMHTSVISLPSHKPPQHVPFEARPPMPLPALPSPPTSESPEPHRHGPFDFTFDPPPAVPISDHVKAFRNTDWAQTPLGPMSEWPPGLRCAVNVVLSNTQPTVLLWGDDATMIYNQASIQILGSLHPCLGQSARTSADFLPVVSHLLNHISSTGVALAEHDLPMFIDRHGFLEETYWSYQFIPLLDDEGYVAGYVNTMSETTTHYLLERRVSSLVELGSQTSNARDFPSFWNLALNTLALNEKDVPFALLYSVEDLSGYDVSSPEHISLGNCSLQGSIGVEANHPIAPSTLSVHDSSYCLHSYLQETVKSREVTVVDLEELGLPENVLAGIDWKGFGEPCRTLIVGPIMPTTGDQIEGFLVLGTNPRRPFDDHYQRFVHVMMRLLGTSLASIVLIDEEVRQRETAIQNATSVQEQLLAKLQLEERKFQKFAERADIAIFVVDPTGQYTYRNNRWYEIFEIAAHAQGAADAWQVIAFPEDLVFCEGIFQQLVTKHEPVCFELKTKMLWNPPADLSEPEGEVIQHHKWILCSAYIELDINGQLVEIVGSVTDISKQKWAEGIQKLRTDSALESKQHLEHFIDTTSHEMRNPLSAIMQCADGILSSYSFGDDHIPSPTTYFDLLEQTLDSAQTIAQCAQHMRHIVDDILTISKLDSGLLVITPVDTQPENIVKHAIKMFDSEARAAEINLSLTVEQSYRDLGIDWVSLDPTRVLQILINLLTNAIKFTRLEKTRSITVSLAASETEPLSKPSGVHFIDTRLVGEDHHLQHDWKRGTIKYIQFSVIDTGRGLSQEETTSLFTRFSQASPRTHIHYGGSGLGLFISRRLTELQGGSIGLVSESNKGSTFSFFIKTRLSIPPPGRKDSIPSVLPEDIRHRTEKPTLKTKRRPSISSPIIQIDESHIWHSEQSPKQPNINTQRRKSLHTSIPTELFDLAPPLDFAELKRTKSIPETLHVLVVEDNLVNQKVLAKQLRNMGCVVSVANHGHEALDFLPRTIHWDHDRHDSHQISPGYMPSIDIALRPPHDINAPIELSLILMDWEMPICDGLTAVARIRTLEKDGFLSARIPVIGVTANVRQQQIQTAITAGMDDVVGKPFRVAELFDRMKGIVAGVRAY